MSRRLDYELSHIDQSILISVRVFLVTLAFMFAVRLGFWLLKPEPEQDSFDEFVEEIYSEEII